MIFGAHTIVASVKSYVNRLFVILTSSMAVWSFSYAISTSAATAEVSAFWSSFSIFGKGFFYSFLLHFVMILTKTESRLKTWTLHALIYMPALINITLFAPFGYFAEKQYQMVQTDFGWVNILPIDMGEIWFILYYTVFSIASIVVLFYWWRRIEPGTLLKRQAKYFLLSVLFPFFLGMTTDTLPEILGKNVFPKLTIIFMMVPVTTLFIASKRLGLLLERETVLSMEIDQRQNIDRLRLFQTAAAIYTVGAAVSFLIGYFGMKKALNTELCLAGFVLLIGLVTRLIPILSKSHTTQNTMFLITNTLGMVFFMITNVETGALTIWAIYILFLLFTVILDSNIHAAVFAVLMVAIQIVYSIFFPKVAVTIDGSEYATRIFIIILSFLVVRHITAEYASKIEAYRKFAKEQEALEKISSNFISVDIENVREKVDEMFEMSADILKFDCMSLIEFSADYEDSTILNMCRKDGAIASSPQHPGMILKTNTLPIAVSLIDQKQPIICENTANLDEDKEVRRFFISRGVSSFFIFPIMVDNNVDGMLIVEYYDRSDTSSREGRLYFLKMIANILGDTKKKTLYEERLYNFAYFDEATQLANRNMLVRKLDQCIHDKQESGNIAVLHIELENLRIIKDTFGHTIGEQIVIKSAMILEQLVGERSYLSRLGEGVFVVVLPAVKYAEEIDGRVERLLDSFSRPISTETGIEALFVVLNIGISVYPDNGRDAHDLLKNADLASYQAKRTNKKAVFYTEQLERQIAENALLTNRLFQSLQNEEFYLEFQPQISCDTGKTVGIEALLRWTTDDGRQVVSDRFIPILEQTGLIYEVGLWVLEQALQEHNRLIAKGFSPLRISINLSAVQLQTDDFIADFIDIIKKSGVEPGYIELEITESFFFENPLDVLEKIYRLKELGISIAIDDFGRGHSSFNRLKSVPFDRLKIDKEIIDTIDVDKKLAPLTEIIILLARAMGASVTAEGVERKKQADFLKSIACDEIQGFYFSKPLSPEALEEFLKNET
ncbi:MAG: EAL domain-containing protein [Spirochaetales bacterium]|nr:EAL domain-containing protein [Spirochaetales bacterium]